MILTPAGAGPQVIIMLETLMALALTSSVFRHDGPIPRLHTCQGSDTSVPLAWSGLPPGTKSLALIVDDPDAPDPAAPKMTWVHWLLYDIPPDSTGLPQGDCARRSAARHPRRPQRLETHRVRRSLPADWPAPVLS